MIRRFVRPILTLVVAYRVMVAVREANAQPRACATCYQRRNGRG